MATRATLFIAILSLLALVGCGSTSEPGFRAVESPEDGQPSHVTSEDRGTLSVTRKQRIDFSDSEIRLILQHSPLGPPPRDSTNRVADDDAAAWLGQALFFDKRLSGNGKLSCASCHDPNKGFADGRARAEGIGTGHRHTMTLWNVAYNRWYFWDGRADSLWSQALQPIENPAEMGGHRRTLASLIADDPKLRAAYLSVYGQITDDIEVLFANLGKAIAAYERRLISRNSMFDRFVQGLRNTDNKLIDASLTPTAQLGLRLFIGKAGCRICHSGPNFTDGEFHDIRIPPSDSEYPHDAARFEGVAKLLADPFNRRGRFNDTDDQGLTPYLMQQPEFWGRYKTPSLRNVAVTGPYMHQGQVATLRAVVQYYSTLKGATLLNHHQEQILKPLNLDPSEVDALVAFLGSLTDVNIDRQLLEPPNS